MISLLFEIFIFPIVPYFLAILILLGLTRMMWRKVRLFWIGVLWLIGPVLFLCGPTWSDRVFNAAEYCAKTGKVVDAVSGEGMPGVYVIAEGSITESAVHTGTYPEYRLVVRTDAKGNYTIPSTWQYAISLHDFWATVWIASSRHQWAITPLMPGYIQPQDESHLIPPNGNAELRVFIENSNPPHRWHGFQVEVLPLRLEKFNLSAAQAVVYYMPLAFGTATDDTRGAQHDMNRALLDYLAAKVCTDAGDSKTATGVAGGLSTFLGFTQGRENDRDREPMPERFQRELKRLEPAGFRPWNDTSVFLGFNYYPYFLTTNVCEAFKLGTAR